jgi:hypothetical protein
MRASDSSMGGEADQFHTTCWTVVMASLHDQSQTGRVALAAICQTYWYPGSAAYFSRPPVVRSRKLRMRSAPPSKPPRSKSRLDSKNARQQPLKNIALEQGSNSGYIPLAELGYRPEGLLRARRK